MDKRVLLVGLGVLLLILILVLTSEDRQGRPEKKERVAVTGLYPAQEPRTGTLLVGDGHELYYEESGNPDGQPALFLHGGPGSGTRPAQRGFFDPAKYRIVLFDQRGAGKSKPAGETENNTTPDLVADVELLRLRLGVKQWVIYGGSWGSTLALAYAEAHPKRVKAMVLRGIFLGRRKEIDWAYKKGGIDWLLPDAFERFECFIPAAERGDLLCAYYGRVVDEDAGERERAVREWGRFEEAQDRLVPAPPVEDEPVTPEAINRVRIQTHYFTNNCFLEEGQLLRDVDEIRHIPVVIIQGRYDLSCPFASAWDLHRALRRPEADFRVVPDAGHSWREPGIIRETIRATDRFR